MSVIYGKECYKIAGGFPRHETYALADQLRRAGVSISNNIAEGSLGSSQNFKKYLNTSIGSTLETVNILNFAYEINYVADATKQQMYHDAEVLIRKIRSFAKSLR